MSKENCNKYLQKQGGSYPRTCKECGLSGCKYENYDKAGLMSLSEKLIIKVDFFKPSGKWYAGGDVELHPDTWPHSPDLKQQIVDKQAILQDGWQGRYIVVTDYYPDKSNRFFKSVYDPMEFMFVSKRPSREKKTAAEWLNESEFSGLILLDSWPIDVEYTRVEFEQKLLKSRVQISKEKLQKIIRPETLDQT